MVSPKTLDMCSQKICAASDTKIDVNNVIENLQVIRSSYLRCLNSIQNQGACLHLCSSISRSSSLMPWDTCLAISTQYHPLDFIGALTWRSVWRLRFIYILSLVWRGFSTTFRFQGSIRPRLSWENGCVPNIDWAVVLFLGC